MSPRLLWGAVLHTLPDRRIQYSPDNSGGNMRILNCYMANDSKGHFVTAKEAAKHNRQDVLCCVSCGCPLTLQRGNDGQPPWFEHDQMTVAEKILLRCTWLDPAEKEARRLHLQGMTVPDYTVKVRKWFCVMCDEDYEGEKCCPLLQACLKQAGQQGVGIDAGRVSGGRGSHGVAFQSTLAMACGLSGCGTRILGLSLKHFKFIF